MKEIIINNKAKVFKFSFYERGRLVTIQVPPGPVSVKETHIAELRKIKMFEILERDKALVVGAPVVEAKDAKETTMPATPDIEEPKKKPKKAKKTKTANMDLEDL